MCDESVESNRVESTLLLYRALAAILTHFHRRWRSCDRRNERYPSLRIRICTWVRMIGTYVPT